MVNHNHITKTKPPIEYLTCIISSYDVVLFKCTVAICSIIYTFYTMNIVTRTIIERIITSKKWGLLLIKSLIQVLFSVLGEKVIGRGCSVHQLDSFNPCDAVKLVTTDEVTLNYCGVCVSDGCNGSIMLSSGIVLFLLLATLVIFHRGTIWVKARTFSSNDWGLRCTMEERGLQQ